MNIRPIRKSLLIHSITLKTVDEPNIYGEKTFTESTVNHVRVEPVKNKILVGSMDENDISKALLFWDRINSDSAEFKTLDKVIFKGDEYTIRKINIYFGQMDLIHHLEMELV